MSGFWKVFGFGAIAVPALGFEMLQRGNLCDPLPWQITLPSGLIGAEFGLLASVQISELIPRRKLTWLVVTAVGLPLLGMGSGTLLARSIALQAAFAGITPKQKAVLMPIKDADSHRRGRRYSRSRSYSITISLPDGAREFSLRATKTLYAEVGPSPEPGKHCIRMTVEEGRWGLRRAIGPNRLDGPLSLDALVPCKRAGWF
ncbi:MAG: hypothetical protein K2Q29_01260 [Sphingomonadales bacterium]|nr:hypothetical protein [Sphingomonadales bacterium]